MRANIVRKVFLFMVAMAFVVPGYVSASDPLDDWTLRSPLYLQAAACGKEVCVVVGEVLKAAPVIEGAAGHRLQVPRVPDRPVKAGLVG